VVRQMGLPLGKAERMAKLAGERAWKMINRLVMRMMA